MAIDLALHLEALIYVSSEPLKEEVIRESLEKTFDMSFSVEQIQEAIEAIREKCSRPDCIYELVEINEAYLFLTKASYHLTVENLLKITNAKKLSKSALETLSIIAYKQPITKVEIEEIRGVSTDYTIRKLLDKELIDISGRSDGPGRPLLYGTSEKFMNYFGLKKISDLPKLKEIVREEQSEVSVVSKEEQ